MVWDSLLLEEKISDETVTDGLTLIIDLNITFTCDQPTTLLKHVAFSRRYSGMYGPRICELSHRVNRI